MAKTIPNRARKNWPKGTYLSRCDYCCAAYMRHELRRNEAGLLACPDDRKGRDEVLLSRLNAEHASQMYQSKNTQDGGANPNDATLPVIHRVSAADITRITS